MANVRVKVFGPLRDIVPGEELTIPVPSPGTVDAAFESLAGKHPALREWRQSVRAAVNMEYTAFDRKLEEGDEIAFIPPVSGG